MSQRIPRRLDEIEIRVVGALLEKEQTTPEAYPLSLNALVAACNQKTNREPVTHLDEAEVAAAIERLRQDVLVWRTDGARVERYKHSVERRWDLDTAAKALLTVLFLRGPQTTGQLRERSERMHAFSGLAQVEETMARLAAEDEPLVRDLPRRPGQKEGRWEHCLGQTLPGASEDAGPVANARHGSSAHEVSRPWEAGSHAQHAEPGTRLSARTATSPAAGGSGLPAADLIARVERLEARLAALEAEVRGDSAGEVGEE